MAIAIVVSTALPPLVPAIAVRLVAPTRAMAVARLDSSVPRPPRTTPIVATHPVARPLAMAGLALRVAHPLATVAVRPRRVALVARAVVAH